ncbi:PqqD family protein [Herbiconiux sp. CPCC 205763]|uniref:PqqD family protein n=1 Tax=Herbiconiux aconitum TaxID=2970913 RepID=A0ABT2GKM2_9MICO|nr:PqqD family protein [Herbiconiux aconitum]MCS5716771.1 PqqD family protein [Herbiconiux aconitum]
MNIEMDRTYAQSSRWRLRSDVAVVAHDERVTVLALEPVDAVPLELAGPGLEIWALVDGQRDLAEIVGRLGDKFGIGAEALLPDVVKFMEQLEAASILERY